MFTLKTDFIKKYEKYLSPVALVTGFIIDSLTLRRIDFLLENLGIVFYLLLAAVGIILLNKRFNNWFLFMTQFAFGGLFSMFTVFYLRSSSFAASWLFILILITLFIGNEIMKDRYAKLTFQLSIYFISLFFFAIFAVPLLLGRIGALVFMLSGALSLLFFTVFLYCASRFLRIEIKESSKSIFISISLIFVLINFLYFTNVIPPIPLSLKEVGVYHSIVHTADGNYQALREIESKKTILNLFRIRPTIHMRVGELVYVYSSVFAPTRLSTEIVHHLYFFDETTGRWVSRGKTSFLISGGRDSGYRGYSLSSNAGPGLWKVLIETSGGQRIGQISYNIEIVSTDPPLEIKNL